VWATGQQLSHLGHPAGVSVTVAILVAGHRTIQARAVIVHDETDVLRPLGEPPFEHDGTGVVAPPVARRRRLPAVSGTRLGRASGVEGARRDRPLLSRHGRRAGSEDATLLATAAQTLVLRKLQPGGSLPGRRQRSIVGG